jgi:hypothetical protein
LRYNFNTEFPGSNPSENFWNRFLMFPNVQKTMYRKTCEKDEKVFTIFLLLFPSCRHKCQQNMHKVWRMLQKINLTWNMNGQIFANTTDERCDGKILVQNELNFWTPLVSVIIFFSITTHCKKFAQSHNNWLKKICTQPKTMVAKKTLSQNSS